MMLVACATPPPVAPHPRTAAEILHETAETYAHAKTYVDQGVQRMATSGSKQARTNIRLTFTTAFVRGGRFRFEYLNFGDPQQATVLWSDGSQTLTTSNGGVDQNASLGDAIDTLTGVSSTTSHTIPALLIPDVGGRLLTNMQHATLGRDESVDGAACWQLTGTMNDQTITLWIDQHTHLIRQIEEQFTITPESQTPAFALDRITRYEPVIDGDVAAALLQAPDTHRQPVRVPQEPAWLGVMFDGHGGTTRVQSVVAGGPAAHAGLQAGDVITKIDAQSVAKAADVILRVRGEKPGATLHLTLSRAGNEMPLDVTLEKRPDLDELQGRFVGQPAPDFALAAMSGPTSAKLADLKGHVVIVDFWATWCGPCAMAMPHLVDLAHKYKDLRVVGISDEDEADIRSYVAAHKIDYTIARDADDVVTGHYLVTGLPTLVIIDKAGVVRALHVGAGDFDTIEAEVQQYLK
jgi:thiol-disulfide isomerase/thioredoxin